MAAIIPQRLLFLDTEFTSLGEPWPVELISVGLSDCHGQRVFYAENDEFNIELTSDFTRQYVLPLLEGGDRRMPYQDLCFNFFLAIEQYGFTCALAADSTWDWLWVQMMVQNHREAVGPMQIDDPSQFPTWPSNLSPAQAHISFASLSRIDKLASLAASASHFKTKFPHHALIDAQGNALCSKAAIEANPGLAAENPEHFCKVFKQNHAKLCWTPKNNAILASP